MFRSEKEMIKENSELNDKIRIGKMTNKTLHDGTNQLEVQNKTDTETKNELRDRID